MFLEKVLTFVVFLGPLVFFHELGHFLFARYFGVRVEVFSLGFGPKIFKKLKGETEYAISIIPLGGYVKMFGDDPLNKDQIPEDQRQYSFTFKTKWQRFWIVMGGPLFNFILAFFIFLGLLLVGEKVPEIKLGFVPENSAFYTQGLRSGDVIVGLNDKDILNPSDLVFDSSKKTSRLKIKRLGNIENLDVHFTGTEFIDELSKYPPFLRKPIFVNKQHEYFVASVNGFSDSNPVSLEEMVNLKIKQFKLIPIREPKDSKLEFVSNKDSIDIKLESHSWAAFIKELSSLGYYPVDLVVKSVNMNSPADKAGIKAGDIFLGIENLEIQSFDQLREELQKKQATEVAFSVLKDGELKVFKIAPEVTKIESKEMKIIGVMSHIEVVEPKFIQTESKGLVASVAMAYERTIDSIYKTLDGFIKLVTQQVSFKNIAGPLSIGKVAHDSLNISVSYFIQLMALISVNLGVINLFPIPVLDGGHIMFIGFEILNRGPLSRRKMEIAQQFGLSILLMLMVGALFNDFIRYF